MSASPPSEWTADAHRWSWIQECAALPDEDRPRTRREADPGSAWRGQRQSTDLDHQSLLVGQWWRSRTHRVQSPSEYCQVDLGGRPAGSSAARLNFAVRVISCGHLPGRWECCPAASRDQRPQDLQGGVSDGMILLGRRNSGSTAGTAKGSLKLLSECSQPGRRSGARPRRRRARFVDCHHPDRVTFSRSRCRIAGRPPLACGVPFTDPVTLCPDNLLPKLARCVSRSAVRRRPLHHPGADRRRSGRAESARTWSGSSSRVRLCGRSALAVEHHRLRVFA